MILLIGKIVFLIDGIVLPVGGIVFLVAIIVLLVGEMVLSTVEIVSSVRIFVWRIGSGTPTTRETMRSLRSAAAPTRE